VSRAQNKTLADLNAAKADLALRGLQAQQALAAAESARAAATAALAGASTAAARATRAQARVRAIIASRAHALAVARHARARVAAQYVELKREQARLRALDRRRGGYQGPVSGELFWPIPGSPIVQGVGPRIHPVYGYKSCHTGDDVKGWYGTPIRAAANGRVIAVLNEGAYGLHTLIAHGGTLSTMYAHQSGVAVHTGQIVQRGQVIGYVGASGWVTGPHLHFEVHVDGVPYDPMGWFGGPKVPVSCWNG
jgi:murein DD-endopeptidase MepM/ murein hydrolase activator NlpD